jgi:hypothetical protein
MQKIEIDNRNFILFRPTPWDTKVFGFNTNEIKEFHCEDYRLLYRLLEMFDVYNRQNNIRFTYTRIDAKERLLKKLLQESGFYYAETSFYLTKKDLQEMKLCLKAKCNLPLTIPEENDFTQIKDIAKRDFCHGRFHEDPFLDIDKAQLRFINIIDDQRNLNREFVVYKKGDEVLAFYVYSIDMDKCDLILGGTRKERSMISYYFWATVLENLRKRGVREAGTMISAANVQIVNLYSFFDFHFEKTLLGFHKFYEEKVHG